MENILVTGGAGFIGSTLCETLLKSGNKVIVIDNFNDYYDPNIKRENIKKITKENFLLYEKDIRDKKALEEIFKNPIDLVIHLAAMAGVRYSIENPELYYEVNVNGTLNLLEQCRKNNIKRFIFASSSSVYGNNKQVTFSEEDNVDYPISPYAATKKSGELLCFTYHHLYNINVACLRFFTVYGPKQRPDLAIHKFVRLILEDKQIPVYGEGATKRDYTYVDDIIDGIVKTIDWIEDSESKYEVFNLGGDHTVSLNEMVSEIEKKLGKKAIINRIAMQQGDVDKTSANISKARDLLKYNPSVSFEEGIGHFINWVKS